MTQETYPGFSVGGRSVSIERGRSGGATVSCGGYRKFDVEWTPQALYAAARHVVTAADYNDSMRTAREEAVAGAAALAAACPQEAEPGADAEEDDKKGQDK